MTGLVSHTTPLTFSSVETSNFTSKKKAENQGPQIVSGYQFSEARLETEANSCRNPNSCNAESSYFGIFF